MKLRSLSIFSITLTAMVFTAGVDAQVVPDDEPDAPVAALRGRGIDKEQYLLERARQIGAMRGVEEGKAIDPKWRVQAVRSLDAQMRSVSGGPTWTEVGPMPIPNGQTVGTTTPVSGRVISIAIHPSNPDIVFVGTASGGLYRSSNGGTSWVPLMDNALSLSIGALAIPATQPNTLYVGTGEHNFSLDSFFGVGVYRITNSTSANPTISGPFNLDGSAQDVFTGRGISEIQVHPSNPDIIFVATTSGVAGIGAAANPTLPSRGVYRSVNATSANPVFEKLTGLAGNANSSVRDIVLDPGNPDLLIAGVVASGGVGGLYTSTNALSASPTFTQTQVFPGSGTSDLTSEFAIGRVSGNPNPVIYAGVGDGGGRVLISNDNGATWTQQIDNNFCTPQCFYNIAIEVDPVDPTRVYIGGAPSTPFAISTNSGTSFANSDNGLHVDSHVIAVSQSDPNVVYFGSDGGIYRSNNKGVNWTPLNNSSFSATQFMSIATHPTDTELMIGGTQDNGTNQKQSNGSWLRVDGGDGGFTGIDQTAADSVNVRMYHTYFNAGNLQGYATRSTVSSSWGFVGCQSTNATGNGITCNGSILFYAPLVLGPGSPNTVYYGSDRLYRSADAGTNHTVVSQNPIRSGVPISAIAIAANDDNLRVVGLRDGGLYRTLTGATTLEEFDTGNAIPNQYIGRIAVDANDNNVVYVALSGFAGAGQNVWKSSNFLSATPTFSAAASGIPNVPVNALLIDPADSATVYAGTDIGVYRSTDSGATWSPLGSGLPRVPVFGLAFNGPSNPGGRGPLRAATHGRGIWEINLTVAGPNIFADGFEGP